MAALVAGVVVPVAIEQVGEDLRLHLAGGEGGVAVGVAFVARCRVRCRDRRAIGIDGRCEDNRLAVRRPEGIVGLGGDGRQLFRIARGSGRAVEIRQPHLLAALAAAEQKNVLAVGRELRAAVAGPGHRERNGFAAGDGLQPQLRCFGVLVEVDGGDGIGQPLAIRRDGRLSQPLHLHHVLEGHGALGLRWQWRAERGDCEGECERDGEGVFAHEGFPFRGMEGRLPREGEVYTGTDIWGGWGCRFVKNNKT